MLEIFAISGLSNALLSIIFGLVVIFVTKKKDARSDKLFFLMTFALFAWGATYWQWLSTKDGDAALFWIRMLTVASTFIPVLYFHWVVGLLGKERSHRLALLAAYGSAIFSASFITSPLLISGMGPKLIFPYWPEAGPLYTFYIFFVYTGFILWALTLLTKKFISGTDKKERGKILFILLGTIFGFGGGATNFFLWYNIPILPYGTILVGLFPFFLGYAVIRHGLFDIKVIATEIFVGLLSFAFLIKIIFTTSPTEKIIDIAMFVATLGFGFLLIKSVQKEVRAREEISDLAKRLTESNWELARTNERLRVIDQRKSEFVSIVSHQLRTPITAIKGYSSMILEESYGKISDTVKVPIEKIFLSSKRLAEMVNDFLDLSKIEQGRMSYNFTSVDIKKMLQDIEEEFLPIAKKKGLSLDFNTKKEGRFIVTADEGKIRQIFTNLLDNAIKYTPSGGIIVSLEKNSKEGKVAVHIKDTGIGLSQDDINHLFGKFARGEGAQKEYTEGSGLGLYVAKKMIEAHHGKMWVDSPGIGKGSEFVVELLYEGSNDETR